jgi:hypothetical protein
MPVSFNWVVLHIAVLFACPQRRLSIHLYTSILLRKIYPGSNLNSSLCHPVKRKQTKSTLCHVKRKVIIKTAEIKIVKRCKQRNKDGGIKCYIFVKKVKDYLHQIVKWGSGTGVGGVVESNHILFTFLMVHCLEYSMQKYMEWTYWN